MRWTFALGAFVVACSGGAAEKHPTKPVPTPLPGNDAKLELPSVPAKIATTTSSPTDASAPDKRSPILDVLKAENEREMAALSPDKSKDPAYYLAYQVVDSRVVSLEADGGALTTDSDETDAQPRRRRPRRHARQLDNTRQLSDDDRRPQRAADPPRHHAVRQRQGRDLQPPVAGDRPPLPRGGPGARPTSSRTRRRCRRRTQAPDFSIEPDRGLHRSPAKLDFDKAKWVERLKRCSASALRGTATRGTCACVFQRRSPVYFVNSEGTQIQQSWTNAQLAVSVGVKADDGENLSRLEQRFGVTPGRPARRRRGRQDDQDRHRRPRRAPRRAARRAVRRAGDPRGPRRRRVLPRGLRPPHRGPPPEGRRPSGQTFARTSARRSCRTGSPSTTTRTIVTLNGIQLNGFYRFDDEGVRAHHAPLVDNGKLVGFLMGRNPDPRASRTPTATAAARRACRRCRARATSSSSDARRVEYKRPRADADRGDQEAEPPLRHDLHRHHRRLHEHRRRSRRRRSRSTR